MQEYMKCVLWKEIFGECVCVKSMKCAPSTNAKTKYTPNYLVSDINAGSNTHSINLLDLCAFFVSFLLLNEEHARKFNAFIRLTFFYVFLSLSLFLCVCLSVYNAHMHATKLRWNKEGKNIMIMETKIIPKFKIHISY